MKQRTYMVIDMKCFYASVECAERQLNPFDTCLVVADETRGKNALCLAVSPKMKALGVKNRCRLSDIPTNINYIIAPPRMHLYIDCYTFNSISSTKGSVRLISATSVNSLLQEPALSVFDNIADEACQFVDSPLPSRTLLTKAVKAMISLLIGMQWSVRKQESVQFWGCPKSTVKMP